MQLMLNARVQFVLGVCLLGAALKAEAQTTAEAAITQENTSAARTVEVYWQRSRTINVDGITNAVVLDSDICAANVNSDHLTLTGIRRGDTLMLVYFGERRENWLVTVNDAPYSGRVPRFSNGFEQSSSSGMFGSTVQTVFGTGQSANYVISNRVFWTEETLGGRLSVSSSFQDLSETGTPHFNVTAGSIFYTRKNLSVALFDSAIDFTGGETGATRFSQYSNFNLRGLNVGWQRGEKNHFQFFAGTSVPYIFTTLSDTRNVYGMSYVHKLNEKISFNATTAVTNLPSHDLLGNVNRRMDFFQLAGATWKPWENWILQATGGGSTNGALALGSATYATPRLNFYGTYSRSSGNFPLNRLESLSNGQNSLSLGSTYLPYPQLALSGFYQHVVNEDNVFSSGTSTSDYINPSAGLQISERQRVYLNYIYSRNTGTSVLGNQSNQRIDTSYALQFPGLSNTAQTSWYTTGDSANLQSQSSFSLGDTVGFKVGHNLQLSAGVTSFHTNLSLTTRLYQQLGLLSPVLQQLFLTDPNAFIQSVNFTPELRAILDDLQPASTQANVSAQFTIGPRISVSPYFNYTHLTESSTFASDTHQIGYSLGYRVTDTLQLTSTLTTLYLFDSTVSLRRTTIFSIGFNKSMNGTPKDWLPFHLRHYGLHGRIYRDMNLNGMFNAGEPGMAGLTVRLSNGETATTDAQGQYEFTGLPSNSYEVSVGLDQFHEQVRVTTPANRTVQVGGKHASSVDFGIVDFARVSGMVFNDYLDQESREPDAEGLPGIKVSLVGKGITRDIVTEPDGSFEMTDIVPGDYEMAIDRGTLPANYTAPQQNPTIHVSPTVSITRDIPVRALRSISGTVLLKVKVAEIEQAKSLGIKIPDPVPSGSEEITLPLAGVQLTVDHTIATTDENGKFVLRNLPAGELTLSFITRKDLPPDMQLPSGKFKSSREPMQLQGTTIVISNLKLAPYLLP